MTGISYAADTVSGIGYTLADTINERRFITSASRSNVLRIIYNKITMNNTYTTIVLTLEDLIL